MFLKILQFFQGRKMSVFLTGSVVIVVMLILYITQPRMMREVDYKVYDAMLPLQKRPDITHVPVIIDIDDASLKAYGQWPWPRYLMAKLLVALKEQGLLSAGLDILLTEPDRTSPEKIKEYLKRDTGINVTFDGIPENMEDYDRLLAEVLVDYPAVLAIYARFDGLETHGAELPPSTGLVVHSVPGAPAMEDSILKASSAILPMQILWEKAPVAMINISPDSDGIIRRIPLVASLDDSVYATLSLRSLMAALGVRNIRVQMGLDGLETIRVGDFSIPVNPDGSMVIPFQGGRKTYQYVSAKDVLEKTLPAGTLEGRIGFVGTSAPGLLDIRSMPFDRVYPGVEIHATVLDTIIAQHFIDIPPWTPGVQVICILFAGILAAVGFGFLRPAIYLPGAVILIGLPLYASIFLFTKGVYISPFYVLLTVIAQGTILLLLRFWQEESQKLVLYKTFSRYVAPEVVKRITRRKDDILAGEEREVTILFTDIRGFTSISEKLDPQQVVLLLNRYFTPMTELVRNNSGTLDKFIGDALMAFWNAPVDVPNHPVKAVGAALGMLENLAALNEELHDVFGIRIDMGAGLHTGRVYVGNMGSEEFLNYTLIGDNVNLTARLESLCSQYGVKIIISADTAERCKDEFSYQVLDTVRVKGKQKAVSIYTVMRKEVWQSRYDEMQNWQAAYTNYMAGRFKDAADGFTLLSNQFADQKLYAVYRERTQILLDNPPSEWDGVWTYQRK